MMTIHGAKKYWKKVFFYLASVVLIETLAPTTVSVKVTWSGNFGAYADPPLLHVEGTPLLYITPDSPRYGFGAWISELYGYTVVFAGYIASPPEHFEVIATATLPEKHTSGEAARD